MAETEKLVEVMMEYPKRLQAAMLGPVRDIAASIPAGDKEARIIGYITGEARGVSWRNNPNSADDSSSGGLIGVFEGTPTYDAFEGMDPGAASEKRPHLASGICFLPEQAQEAVIKAMGFGADRPRGIKRGQKQDQLGTVVPIAVEIAIRKSDGPVGYEWVCRGLARISAQSPVERMRALMGTGPGADLARIVDQSEKGAKALPAPDKPVGKTKAAKGSRKR